MLKGSDLRYVQTARLSTRHWARHEVVWARYAEWVILEKARGVVISWMQSKIPSNVTSPCFPRFASFWYITLAGKRLIYLHNTPLCVLKRKKFRFAGLPVKD
nr:hypothetical protein Iba_chr01bCG10850 [Ipomoea batatas]